jgi:hypothetical protein
MDRRPAFAGFSGKGGLHRVSLRLTGLVPILHCMGGSAAEAPTTPDAEPAGGLRASDAERDKVLARLREGFAAGRLSHDTFLIRMDAVLRARHQADLTPLLADLGSAWPPAPARPSPPDRLRAALARWRRPRASRRGKSTFLVRLTGGMPRSAEEARSPLALRFPRGSGRFFSIGRDIACDLAIADPTVSREHARLERTDDGWLLTDLASTNGTRVNGWRVRDRVPVTAGDLVSFGNAEFWLTAPQAPEAEGT